MNTFKYIFIAFIIVVGIFIYFDRRNTSTLGWNFVGYQYRWSENYVENKGLNSELTCLDYGNRWLSKQKSEEALFTCSTGCKDASIGHGMQVCKKICEYDGHGLVRCRQ